MSGTSVKHYYEVINSSFMSGHDPCDTYASWTVLDNIKHLCDSSPHYVVNYVTGATSAAVTAFARARPPGGPYSAELYIEFQFPTTVLQNGKYPNYDVQLGGFTTHGTLKASVTIGALSISRTAVAGASDVIGSLSATTTSTTPVEIISGKIIQGSAVVPVLGQSTTGQAIAASIAGETVSGWNWYGKACILLTSEALSGYDYLQLSHLMIREYTA